MTSVATNAPRSSASVQWESLGRVADEEAKPSRNSDTASSMQLVSFQIADEEYGIEISKVREIILVGEITRIPETPPYVKGLINLRNSVIPIVDLKQRLGLAETPTTDDTRIVVVTVRGKTIGLIVDVVSEVLRVATSDISPPPQTVAGNRHEYLAGLVGLDDRLLILIDIEKLLVEEDDQHDSNNR